MTAVLKETGKGRGERKKKGEKYRDREREEMAVTQKVEVNGGVYQRRTRRSTGIYIYIFFEVLPSHGISEKERK